MSAIIDIHPHIIANDAARYPRAPLGGHQSDWSRTRPVTVAQLVKVKRLADELGGVRPLRAALETLEQFQ